MTFPRRARSGISARRVSFSFLFGLFLIPVLIPAGGLAQENQAVFAETRTGIYRGKTVTYTIVNGLAVYQGDIILEGLLEPSRENSSPKDSARPRTASTEPIPREGIGIAYPSNLWPKVGAVYQVPYIITTGSANMTAAISAFNSTFSGLIQFVARTAEPDYVNVNLTPGDSSGTCQSYVGRIGGPQLIGGAINCNVGVLLHEMGHSVGLWHEQSRSDRNTYVTVAYQNIIRSLKDNFDQELDNAQDLGLYDYRSAMHYHPFAFTRNGDPTIESIPAGIPMTNTVGYTEGDVDSIKRLYGVPPHAGDDRQQSTQFAGHRRWRNHYNAANL